MSIFLNDRFVLYRRRNPTGRAHEIEFLWWVVIIFTNRRKAS